MTVLAALNRAYQRMADRREAPPFGYSLERIGFLIPLQPDGSVAGAPIDLRQQQGKKLVAPLMAVPQPAKRTSGISANFLADKTAYALGVTAGEGRRTAEEHAAFVGRQREALAGTDDPGLLALLRFYERWRPEEFAARGWPEEMKDQNVAFTLESDRLSGIYLHDRPAARAIWARLAAGGSGTEAACLVTGEHGPVARLHPAIKGVWGAQTSGASIVSFNADAFESFGQKQGANAPVSEAAAFAYTTVLNRFLDRDSRHRLQIGDASTVFWADAADAEAARVAEDTFAAALEGLEVDESAQSEKVRTAVEAIRAGRPLPDPDLAEGVRFYVLGLAPNASRLSVRFWVEDDFGAIAERLRKHAERMRIEPPWHGQEPSIRRYLFELAALGKAENVPPNLAGEWLRAILTGGHYPLTLLSMLLVRIRADRGVNALRAAMLKAVLINNFHREVTVGFDPGNADRGYLLGRLFATYEQIQSAALGRGVNATIRDKFYGAASATPRRVFPHLNNNAATHLAKIRKEQGRRINFFEKLLGEIIEKFDPAADPFPAFLPAEQQALFTLGYYQQRSRFFQSREKGDGPGEVPEEPQGQEEEGE